MSAYIKVRDRHKPRKAAECRRVRCDKCKEPTFAPYWWTVKGHPRLEPLCRDCHERDVRQPDRDGPAPDNRIRDED